MTSLLTLFTVFSALVLPAPPRHAPAKPAVIKPAPPFSLQADKGVWWLKTPQGKRFFSLGVCCVEPGTVWKEYNPKNPSYSAWRHYPDPASWADETLQRLSDWGFTTIGGWSDYATLKRSPKFKQAYTLVLHLGSSSGAPWFDMWSAQVIQKMDEVAKAAILPVRNDPRLLGYYTDNELGWWSASQFQITLDQPAESGQRKRLIELLQERYANNWNLLLKDFIPKGADSFLNLALKGNLYLRPQGDGIHTVKKFTRLLAERYYQLVRAIVRRYDARGLILGDRYQSFYYPEVAESAITYVDAVSTNLNAHWNDGSLSRFYLSTLFEITHKPLMIGEFYMASTENRSGNKNNASVFPVVKTQEERAINTQRTLQYLLETPYLAGADWFQYADEPMLGRSDGENYNMGLVDNSDAPYTELTAMFAKQDLARMHTAAVWRRANANLGVPPAPAKPFENWKPMSALEGWDRERGFAPPSSLNPLADMYLCWDKSAVYVGLFAMDFAEDSFYQNKRIPESERAFWSVTASKASPIRIRLGANRPPKVATNNLETQNVVALTDGVRVVAGLRLPARLFGKTDFKAGDKITFTSTLDTFARSYQVTWRGTYTLTK